MTALPRKPWVRDFTHWTAPFMDNVKASGEARRVWKQIQECSPPPGSGLAGQAALLLWFYAGGARGMFEQMHAQAADNNRLLKSAIRAELCGGSPVPQGPGRPRKPPDVARAAALASPFTGAPGDPATLGDVIAAVKRDTGRKLSIAETRAVLVRSAGPRSQYNEKSFLAVLQELAASRGLSLGFKKLAALARCANPEKYQGLGSERNLQAYLRGLWPDARPTIRAELLPIWKRLGIPRSELPHLFALLR